MKRWQADCLLAFVGLIWGFGFVAQKDAIPHLGTFTFVACRFLISAIFVLPFALREGSFRSIPLTKSNRRQLAGQVAGLCAAFAAGVLFQQFGLLSTTATSAAFITCTYVVLVPFVARLLYGRPLSLPILAAAGLSCVGMAILTGLDPRRLLSSLRPGDALEFLCAAAFALQVAMMSHIVTRFKAPFALSLLQYLVLGLASLAMAVATEDIGWHVFSSQALLPILYAGIASGGIAYTLQAVAQQNTPPAEAAVILSSESLFGAVGGAWLLHERLQVSGYVGCAIILSSILLVELIPAFQTSYKRA